MANPAQAAAANKAGFTLTITRVFDAPREAVFQAWIDPAQIARWIGPRSIRAEVKQMDARPGGTYRIFMHGRETGQVNIVRGTYREVVPPERLVFTWGWEDTGADRAAGGPPPLTGPETVVTLTFRAMGKQTEMTLRHEGFATEQSRDSHNVGWTGSFDKLAEALAGRPTGR